MQQFSIDSSLVVADLDRGDQLLYLAASQTCELLVSSYRPLFCRELAPKPCPQTLTHCRGTFQTLNKMIYSVED
jgi:hypothetical protein